MSAKPTRKITKASQSSKELIEELRLMVFMPAKALARRGEKHIWLMGSEAIYGRSIWDWWGLFKAAGVDIQSVLNKLTLEEIGPDWEVGYDEWHGFLHGSRRYYLTRQKDSKKKKK